MTSAEDDRLAAEQRARVLIDRQLEAAGWAVQDKKDLNLFAAQGVATLMLQYRVGVQPQSSVTLYEVDEDYFEGL